MAELDDAFAPLIAAEQIRTPARADLETRTARRRRRRWARGGAALLVVVVVIAGVATLARGQKQSIRITGPSTTTAPRRASADTNGIGWRVDAPPGWHVRQSNSVCNPGERGIVVSRDPKAFSAAENEVGCFIGEAKPIPAGKVVVSLSISDAPVSASTPPTPLPISLADVPVDATSPALRYTGIFEGDKQYLVRVVLPPGAPPGSSRIVDGILRSLRPVVALPVPELVGARASALALPDVEGIAFDAAGNLYLADATINRVLAVDPAGIVTRVIGTGSPGFGGDGGPAAGARLAGPTGLAVDGHGNLYIADRGDNRIRRVTPDGIITTYAGTGALASGPDGRPADRTALDGPTDLLWDAPTSSLYVSEGSRVRRIGPDGIVHTVAGDRGSDIGYEEHPNGLATATSLCGPVGIAISRDRSLWIAGDCDKSIARVAPDGRIHLAPGHAFRLAAAPDGSVSAYYGRSGGIDRVTPSSDTGLMQLDNRAPASSCIHYLGNGDDDAALAWRGDVLYFANPSTERVCALAPDGHIDTIVGG